MKMSSTKRNYEKYAQSAPKIIFRPAIKEDITVACILRQATFDSLLYECTLIPLTKENYTDILCNSKINRLLIECSFYGYDGLDDWINQITDIVELAKKAEIKSVFWDTDEYDLFNNNEIMNMFDYIFTVASNRVDQYKEVLSHPEIFFLPFGVQQRIYNPVERNIVNKEGEISRASSNKLERLIGVPNKVYSILYEKTLHEQTSPVPEDIFRLLASGTTIVSPYLKALEELFPGIVKLYNSEAELYDIIRTLSEDRDLAHKLSVLGQRMVLSSHTYTNRIDTILEKTGLQDQVQKLPGVTMVTSTNRPDSINNVFQNYENQSYCNKELIVVLNNNKMDLGEWRNRAQQYKNVKVFQIDESQPLGRCLNHAIDNSSFPYFSKCDDDNYYAPNFLSDLMSAFKYADAEIVGKLTYYCYLEGCRTLAIMCPNMEYRYVNMLSGSALIIKREVFDKVRFGDKPTGSDSVFLKECVNNGVRMYSADRFNYVYNRHASQENHTWKMSDEVFLRSCKVVDITDEYIQRVTV